MKILFFFLLTLGWWAAHGGSTQPSDWVMANISGEAITSQQVIRYLDLKNKWSGASLEQGLRELTWAKILEMEALDGHGKLASSDAFKIKQHSFEESIKTQEEKWLKAHPRTDQQLYLRWRQELRDRYREQIRDNEVKKAEEILLQQWANITPHQQREFYDRQINRLEQWQKEFSSLELYQKVMGDGDLKIVLKTLQNYSLAQDSISLLALKDPLWSQRWPSFLSTFSETWKKEIAEKINYYFSLPERLAQKHQDLKHLQELLAQAQKSLAPEDQMMVRLYKLAILIRSGEKIDWEGCKKNLTNVPTIKAPNTDVSKSELLTLPQYIYEEMAKTFKEKKCHESLADLVAYAGAFEAQKILAEIKVETVVIEALSFAEASAKIANYLSIQRRREHLPQVKA
ncbi:MAG: hypothetical protein WCG27_08050, partial [Pseudomonadota bacterium]